MILIATEYIEKIKAFASKSNRSPQMNQNFCSMSVCLFFFLLTLLCYLGVLSRTTRDAIFQGNLVLSTELIT